MNPAEREAALKGVINLLETELTKLTGKRLNFVLVIGEYEGEGAMYVSHLSNTPRELAERMLKALYQDKGKH